MTARSLTAPAPRTAAEALSLAARLEREEAERAAQQAERDRFAALTADQQRAELRDRAQQDAWSSIRANELADLDDKLSGAAAAWHAAAADPEAGIGQLFDAWHALRVASATRASVGHATAASLTRRPSGVMPDGLDQWGVLTFGEAVESALAQRAKAAADLVLYAVSAKATDAGDAAAATVKG